MTRWDDLSGNRRKETKPKTTNRPRKCEECGIYWAEDETGLCPGCEAYKEHQQ